MPRESGRLFPDVAQLGIGAITVLNESRVTFTGAEGLVLLLCKVQVINAGAVAIPQVSLGFQGSVVFSFGYQGQAHAEAVAGRVMSLEAMLLFRNPSPGSFVEYNVATTGGTVDVSVSAGFVLILSWDAQDLGGPVATIA